MNSLNKFKDATVRVAKNFSPALVDSLSTLGLVNPAFIPLISLAHSILGYWGDYANDKTKDLLQEFVNNKEKIVAEVVSSDKFKAIFLKILSDNITESNEEKRKYLKNYIVNFACGVESDFNEHSKLIYTLNNITLEEIEMLKMWDETGAVEKRYREIGDAPGRSIRDNALDVSVLAMYARDQKASLKILNFDRIEQSKNNQILLSLGYKDLLYVLSADNFGSGVEAKTKGLTDFGRTFLNFIKK